MTYEYQCRSCGQIVDRQAKMSERKNIVKCDHCGGVAKRIISRGSFSLRGEGWAKDGYARGSRK